MISSVDCELIIYRRGWRQTGWHTCIAIDHCPIGARVVAITKDANDAIGNGSCNARKRLRSFRALVQDPIHFIALSRLNKVEFTGTTTQTGWRISLGPGDQAQKSRLVNLSLTANDP